MEPRIGSIFVNDVEELQYTVDPWVLRMNQLSSGNLRASFSFARLNSILLTRECWTRKIYAAGLSPPGFIAFAANCAGPRLSFCGSTLTKDRVVYAFDGQEIDFLTAENEDHWVMLLPTSLIEEHLGEELVSSMRTGTRLLQGEPQLISELTSRVLHTMAVLMSNEGDTIEPMLLDVIQEQLLATVTRIILNSHDVLPNREKATKRFLAYQQARYILEASEAPYSIEELTKFLGVSRRSLEVGFREEIVMSPQAFSRCIRLNGVHRDLLHASQGELKVTAALQSKGFTELGRASGYYRNLFGESPSDTLNRKPPDNSTRLSDSLNLEKPMH